MSEHSLQTVCVSEIDLKFCMYVSDVMKGNGSWCVCVCARAHVCLCLC